MDRYCFAIDGGDSSGWLACFTTEATFRSVSTDGLHLELTGYDQLSVWIESYHQRFDPWTVRHVVSGTVADVVADAATSTTTYLTLMTSPEDGSVRIQTTGRYLDSLMHDGHSWRIAERTAHRDLGRPA